MIHKLVLLRYIYAQFQVSTTKSKIAKLLKISSERMRTVLENFKIILKFDDINHEKSFNIQKYFRVKKCHHLPIKMINHCLIGWLMKKQRWTNRKDPARNRNKVVLPLSHQSISCSPAREPQYPILAALSLACNICYSSLIYLFF